MKIGRIKPPRNQLPLEPHENSLSIRVFERESGWGDVLAFFVNHKLPLGARACTSSRLCVTNLLQWITRDGLTQRRQAAEPSRRFNSRLRQSLLRPKAQARTHGSACTSPRLCNSAGLTQRHEGRRRAEQHQFYHQSVDTWVPRIKNTTNRPSCSMGCRIFPMLCRSEIDVDSRLNL